MRTVTGVLSALALLAPARGAAQSDTVVTPGARYEAGGFRSFFAGAGYRALWATPIRVPLADLDRLGGGLTPLRLGGGMTTETLHLMGRDGRRYVLRSVDKSVGLGLSEELRGTLFEALLQDQVSSFLPTGALVLPPLLEAVGLLHAAPRLVLVPDSPRLEEFREQFAGRLALFEERPDDREGPNPGFQGAQRVASTPRLIEHLRESSASRVDAREFLSARLVDLLVGDRDRSVNNWLWARFDTAGGQRYRPIPRDRDQAFIRLDGALKWYLRFYDPRLVRYSAAWPSVTGLTRNAWDMDRPFLVALARDEWDRAVAETEAALSDAVLEAAVARLPAEHHARLGARLEHELKTRRDALAEAADELYRIVNQAADIHATDEAEVARVVHEADGTLSVTLAPARTPGAPYFRRSFDPAVTHEVRLYLLGGDDSVTVSGTGAARIAVRVVGGDGHDRFVDLSSGGSPPRFYDGAAGSIFVTGRRTRVRHESFEPPVSWGNLTAHPPDWGSTTQPLPGLPFRGDLGFFPKFGISVERYGFRKEPYAARHQLEAGWAAAQSRFRVAYRLDRVVTTERTRVSLVAYWSQVELSRYYGLGNDTEADGPRGRFRAHHDQAALNPSATFTRGAVALRVGAHVKRSVTDTTGGSLLAEEKPYGTGTFTQVGGGVTVLVDTRDDATAPSRGIRASTGVSYTPGILSVDSGGYFGVEAAAAAYLSAFGERHTLALRASGRKLFGDVPIHDAAFLGGSESLRGFRTHRFAGDAFALGSVELRSRVGHFRVLFPNDFGLVAFGDGGRVFVDGQSPGGWHTALGGGLWIAPVSRSHSFSMTLARSREYTAFNLTTGFAF